VGDDEMTSARVRFMGEDLPLAALLRHYHLMARNARRMGRSTWLWRTLAHTAIEQYREQRAESVEHREAA
jgi:DNA-directed RNA polymerase specialized sigma24 family protein